MQNDKVSDTYFGYTGSKFEIFEGFKWVQNSVLGSKVFEVHNIWVRSNTQNVVVLLEMMIISGQLVNYKCLQMGFTSPKVNEL